jgi:hypothetical protein
LPLASCLLAIASPALSDTVFSTGNPNGLIGTASRPDGPSQIEIETADDFVLTQETAITGGTFTGLVPTGTNAGNITNVVVEIYRVFPLDSTVPPSGNVLTRANSPSDTALTSADMSLGQLMLVTSTLSSNFTVANSVVNGIFPSPNQFTGGEGAVSGQEVLFSFSFLNSLDLAADHYFFVPQVQLSNGTFLWLSAPRPIVAPGTPFPTGTTDLQSWIRNGNLAPDWSRVGTDITHQGPFNAAFSLDGFAVPEPSTWMMMILGFAAAGWTMRKTRRQRLAV